MSTVEEMDVLRGVETQAQDVVTQAKDAARDIRAKTQERVEALARHGDDELTAMRERVQAEAQTETETALKESQERVASQSKQIGEKLESSRDEAVKVVVEALIGS